MPKRNLAWILVVATIALLMWQLPQTIAVRDSVYEAFGPLVEVRAEIRKRFVEDIDDAELVDTAVTAGIEAMVVRLDDPYARYLDAREYDRFKKRTDGVIGGVGVDVWATEAGLEVLSREPGSPAAMAGILPGEIITHIDDRPMKDVSLVDAVHMLNGPSGSEVVVTVEAPAGRGIETSTRQVRLRRTEVEFDSVRGWARSPGGGWWYMLDPEARIAYIRVTKFTSHVDRDLDAVVNRLCRHKLGGLVLDLRDNTGGLLESGIEVADRFIEKGLLVRESGRKTAPEEWYASRERTYPHFPMAVLINGSTASAAEMVSGALRDHGRAALVGERSYGKGCVQKVVELQHGGGAIQLTTAYYYLPSGRCIHRTPEAVRTGQWGVEPTLPVSLTDQQRACWLAARRETTRELVPGSASQPTTTSQAADEDAERRATARALLDADLQLRKAVEYLRKRQDAETSKRPESRSRSNG
ncbi:MAG: S41 family peptidase [Phycisphaerae bacterium]|nr:S41 family peptidase [Phycisphaerae bacterium]